MIESEQEVVRVLSNSDVAEAVEPRTTTNHSYFLGDRL